MISRQPPATAGEPAATRPGPYMLDPATVGAYLAGHGLLAAGQTDVAVLAGGVSNDVLLVRQDDRRMVVKQALGRLRVAADWPASRARILTEAQALECAGRLTPGSVPGVIAVVPEDFVLVMDAAPDDLRPWKQDLLAERISIGTAARLGELLGTWHAATARDRDLRGRFENPGSFTELRIDPYHRTVAACHPDLAGRIDELTGRLVTARQCLVHGDFSPKNMLVDEESTVIVLDWEVAHCGDPVFDLAFLLCHLRCKALRRPRAQVRYQLAAAAFLGSYHEVADQALPPAPEAELVAQAACLLLARVDGKSPVEYLGAESRPVARQLARELLQAAAPTLEELWRS